MENFRDRLRAETEALAQRLDTGPPSDPDALRADLELLTEIHSASKLVSRYAPDLVKAALTGGIPQGELVGLPYHETQVRRLAREAGIEPQRSGPKPTRPVTNPR